MYTIYKVIDRGRHLRPFVNTFMKVPNWSVDEVSYMLNHHNMWFVRDTVRFLNGPIVYGCPHLKKIFLCLPDPAQYSNVYQVVCLYPWQGKSREDLVHLILRGDFKDGYVVNRDTGLQVGTGKYLMGTLQDTGVMSF